MNHPDFTSEDLRNYLLGRMDAPNSGQLNARRKTDEDLADALELAESQLVDDYAEGLLVSEDKTAFERFFLTTTDRREKLRLAAGMQNMARNDARRSRLKWISILLSLCVLVAIVFYQQIHSPQIVQLFPNNTRSPGHIDIRLSEARSTIILEFHCPRVPPALTLKFGRIGEPQPVVTARLEKPSTQVVTIPVRKSMLAPGDYLAMLSADGEFRADFRLIVAP